jgi:hypothetical protein
MGGASESPHTPPGKGGLYPRGKPRGLTPRALRDVHKVIVQITKNFLKSRTKLSDHDHQLALLEETPPLTETEIAAHQGG